MIKICPKCGAELSCKSGEGFACWCSDFPKIMPMEKIEGCMCPECLKEEIIKSINHYLEEYDLKQLKELVKKYDNERNTMIEGIDYYIENGLLVYTKWYHLRRGYCCGNGCRHCAYKSEHV